MGRAPLVKVAMKVTIDLDRLLKDGKTDRAEYDKFSRFSAGMSGWDPIRRFSD